MFDSHIKSGLYPHFNTAKFLTNPNGIYFTFYISIFRVADFSKDSWSEEVSVL